MNFPKQQVLVDILITNTSTTTNLKKEQRPQHRNHEFYIHIVLFHSLACNLIFRRLNLSCVKE